MYAETQIWCTSTQVIATSIRICERTSRVLSLLFPWDVVVVKARVISISWVRGDRRNMPRESSASPSSDDTPLPSMVSWDTKLCFSWYNQLDCMDSIVSLRNLLANLRKINIILDLLYRPKKSCNILKSSIANLRTINIILDLLYRPKNSCNILKSSISLGAF